MTFKLKIFIGAAAFVAFGAVASTNVALADDVAAKPDAMSADHMSSDHMERRKSQRRRSTRWKSIWRSRTPFRQTTWRRKRRSNSAEPRTRGRLRQLGRGRPRPFECAGSTNAWRESARSGRRMNASADMTCTTPDVDPRSLARSPPLNRPRGANHIRKAGEALGTDHQFKRESQRLGLASRAPILGRVLGFI